MDEQEYKKLKKQHEELTRQIEEIDTDALKEFERMNVAVPKNAKELSELLRRAESGEIDFDRTFDNVIEWASYGNDFKHKNFTLRHVQTKGGHEGDGEEYWMVIAVEVDGEAIAHYEWTGYYASYDGVHLDNGPYEVTPKEKTITVFEKKL